MPFPTPPGLRVPYDLDGSTGFLRNSGTNILREFTAQDLRYLNGENTAGLSLSTAVSDRFHVVSLIFPVSLRLRGIFFHGISGRPSSGNLYGAWSADIETSENSTNSVDGTWTSLGTRSDDALYRDPGAIPAWDSDTQAPTTLQASPDNNIVHRKVAGSYTSAGIHLLNGIGTRNVQAVRLALTSSSISYYGPRSFRLHVYGEPDTDARTDRLQMWRSDVDLPLGPADIDWGDVPQASSADKSFRVKNVSASLSANAVTVFASPQSVPLLSPSPAPEGFLLFSSDGGLTWKTTLDFSTLSPGALSPVIQVRRTVPLSATLSTWSPRITATVATWA